MHIYIYIYIFLASDTANPRTKNLDLTRFDSNMFLNLRCGIPRSTGNFPEIESQPCLVCGFLACGLTADDCPKPGPDPY